MNSDQIFWDGTTPDYLIITDIWGNISELVNHDGNEKILGYTNKELIEKNAITLLHPGIISRIIKDMQVVFANIKSGKYHGILPIKDKSGEYINVQFIADYNIEDNRVSSSCRKVSDNVYGGIFPVKSRKPRSDKGKSRKSTKFGL